MLHGGPLGSAKTSNKTPRGVCGPEIVPKGVDEPCEFLPEVRQVSVPASACVTRTDIKNHGKKCDHRGLDGDLSYLRQDFAELVHALHDDLQRVLKHRLENPMIEDYADKQKHERSRDSIRGDGDGDERDRRGDVSGEGRDRRGGGSGGHGGWRGHRGGGSGHSCGGGGGNSRLNKTDLLTIRLWG